MNYIYSLITYEDAVLTLALTSFILGQLVQYVYRMQKAKPQIYRCKYGTIIILNPQERKYNGNS